MKRSLPVALAVFLIPGFLLFTSCSKTFNDEATALPTDAASTEAIDGFYKMVWDPVGETNTLDRMRTGVVYSFELQPTPAADRHLYFFIRIIDVPVWVPLLDPYHLYYNVSNFVNVMWMLPGTYEIAVKESKSPLAPDLLSHRFEVYDSHVRIAGPTQPKVNTSHTFQAAARTMYATKQVYDFVVKEKIWDDPKHGRAQEVGAPTISMDFPEPGKYEIWVYTNDFSGIGGKRHGIYDLEFYYRPEFEIESKLTINQYGSTETRTLRFYADKAHRIPMATPYRVRLRYTTQQGTIWTLNDGSQREEWKTPTVSDRLVASGTMSVVLPATTISTLGNTTRITRTDVDYYPDHCGDRFNTYEFPVGPF